MLFILIYIFIDDKILNFNFLLIKCQTGLVADMKALKKIAGMKVKEYFSSPMVLSTKANLIKESFMERAP